MAVAVLSIAVMVMIAASLAVVMLGPLAVFASPAGMLLTIAFLHPLLLDEVHGLATSAVASAVSGPVLMIGLWHVEVDGLLINGHRCGRDDDRLWIYDNRLRVAPDVDPAINTRLIDPD